jgi:heme exporter protein D
MTYAELIPYAILAVAIVVVAFVALHAMDGVRDNRRYIDGLRRSEDFRWKRQDTINDATIRRHMAIDDRVREVEARTQVSDGK